MGKDLVFLFKVSPRIACFEPSSITSPNRDLQPRKFLKNQTHTIPYGYSSGDGDYSVVARWTALLLYSNDDSEDLHLGVSGKQASAVGQAGLPSRVPPFRTRDAVRSGLSSDWPRSFLRLVFICGLRKFDNDIVLLSIPGGTSSVLHIISHQFREFIDNIRKLLG